MEGSERGRGGEGERGNGALLSHMAWPQNMGHGGVARWIVLGAGDMYPATI